MTDEHIAQVAHEVNRAYCEALGDTSQPAWGDAPDWQRNSAKNGVVFHRSTTATPKESHENWLKQKREEGWVYGPVKDPALKQHPCFLPYEDLPAEQRAKDYIFRAVVNSLASIGQ